jgi:hypothetical protein
MLPVLQFVLGGFWTFLGTVILIWALGNALVCIIRAFFPWADTSDDEQRGGGDEDDGKPWEDMPSITEQLAESNTYTGVDRSQSTDAYWKPNYVQQTEPVAFSDVLKGANFRKDTPVPAKTKGEEIAERMVESDDGERIGIGYQRGLAPAGCYVLPYDRSDGIASGPVKQIRRAIASAIDAALKDERERCTNAIYDSINQGTSAHARTAILGCINLIKSGIDPRP